MTGLSGVSFKRTSVSRPVAKLHIQYRCRLVRQTSYACSPEVDDSVLIVIVRECIVVTGSVSAPRPLLGWTVFQYSIVSLELNVRIYRACRFWRLSFLIAPGLGRTVE